MPKRTVLKSITLGRGKLVEDKSRKDGRGNFVKVPEQRLELTIGQVFDFTEEELRQVTSVDPDAVSSTMVVNIDDNDVDLKKLGNSTQMPNQQSGPGASGEGQSNGDGEL